MSTEVTELPAVLVDELARAEQHTLTDLTEGGGVQLEAFVVTPDGPRIVTLDADRRADADAAVRLLEQQASVEAADLTVIAKATAGSISQWGNTAIRSVAARAEVTSGALAGVVVAVLDTGVSPHSELTAALLPGRNFTPSGSGASDSGDVQGHGTHVAGTVAADAGSGVEGIAVGAKVLPVKVLDDSGSGASSWISSGILWAADQGADVINMSLGGQYSSTVYDAAIAYARSQGTTVIAAAGNANTSATFMPAAAPGVIGVAATDQNRGKASFSNYGSYVDVAAPGVNIASTYPGNRYVGMNGTSMASPHVAGVVALMVAAAPAITPDQVEQALTSSATDLGVPGRDDYFGSGQVDALNAVRAARALAGPPAPVVRTPSAPRIGTPAAVAAGVKLSWAPPVDDGGAAVTSYRLSAYRGATVVRSVVVNGSTTSTTLTGLTNGTAVRLGVEAGNAAGWSPPSASITATPRTTPGAPKIGATTAQKKAVVVRWAKPASDGGTAITAYVVQVYAGGKLVKAVNARATKTSATVSGLKAGKAYTFRVVAKNAAGTGAVSAASKATRPR
ncbi:MAG: S8 family serine peptidase [Blastococcus sp.]|nr:S8 family serine peptidase [Blastococcus sp.]